MPRPKGSVNLKTEYLNNMAKRLEIDPFEVLILFAGGRWKELGYKSETVTKFFGENMSEEYTITPELRMHAASKACEYLYPKRKAIEHSIEEGTVTNITRTILTKKID